MSNLIPLSDISSDYSDFGLDDDLDVSTPKMPRLSIAGSKFTLVNPDGSMIAIKEWDLPVIILATSPGGNVKGKSFYKNAYNPDDDPTMPDCFSKDGKKPDPSAENAQAVSCDVCPHNVAGTATDAQGNPTKGKRCKDTKTLFIVFPEDIEGTVYQLRVPPTSFKSLGEYSMLLKRHKTRKECVVTSLSFVDGKAWPELKFECAGVLPKPVATLSFKRAMSDEVRSLVTDGPDLSPVEAPALPTYDVPKQLEHKEPIEAVAKKPETIEAESVQIETESPQVDSKGLPWDERINTSNKAKTKKGVWKRKPGLDDDFYDDVIDELSGSAPVAKKETPSKQVESVFDEPTTEEVTTVDSLDDIDALLEGFDL